MNSSALLKFQIGPVQDFIAQARSTRDLWSGSYLLSWLVAAGIRKLIAEGGALIFPNDSDKCQPLLELPELAKAADHNNLLTPNLPNIFIARVSVEKPEVVAKAVKAAIKDEWQKVATAVWDQRGRIGLPDAAHDRFFAQVDRHLSISWMITPLPDDSATSYLTSYQNNGWHLDAVRQTRDFAAGASFTGITEKDSLSGKEEALVGGTDYQQEMVEKKFGTKETIGEAYASLFAKHADYLGAVAIIKRCWHLAYLNFAHQPRLKTRSKDFPIRSIPAIAARTDKLDDDELAQEKTSGEKYIAAIAFDGDTIGRWVNGDFLPNNKASKILPIAELDLVERIALARNRNQEPARSLVRAVGWNFCQIDRPDRSIKRGKKFWHVVQVSKHSLKQHHSDFSSALSGFALGEVRKIVEGSDADQKDGIWKGQLIYAGGDDVVCLVPADVALEVAEALRKAFRESTTNTPATGDKPDASAGIAIAHIHSPLQDLIREAQKAEKRAKNEVGRPAFSITLMKRSGEISQWGSQWSSGGLELYQAIAERIRPGGLSDKFPHRVCQLLTPYLIQQTGLTQEKKTITDAIDDAATAKDLIAREFAHAAERQGSKALAAELAAPLVNYLDGLLAVRTKCEQAGKPSAQSVFQELLTAVIGLCTTLAFAQRTALETLTAEKQTATP